MSVNNFAELHAHAGHHIVCVEYGNKETGCVNVSLECEDCGEVLIDFDRPADIDFVPLQAKFKVICPECLEASSLDDWNEETQLNNFGEITPLEEEDFSNHTFVASSAPSADCDYVCPCCKRTSVGEAIRSNQ